MLVLTAEFCGGRGQGRPPSMGALAGELRHGGTQAGAAIAAVTQVCVTGLYEGLRVEEGLAAEEGGLQQELCAPFGLRGKA